MTRQFRLGPDVGMQARPLFAVVLLTCTLGAQTRGPLDLANAPVPAGAHRIAYGADPLQFGELRVPAGPGPHPVAIVVHGGCYRAQPRDPKADPRAIAMDNMRPLAAALADAGIATWNVEYRRRGNDGGGWPGTFRDVAAAADFLRTLARDHPLDLTRVISIGHSAGGHLAMWLGARPRVPGDSEVYVENPLRLTGVINLDGPADLRAAIERQEPICGSPVVTDLMGGSPNARADRYRATSPAEMLPLGVPDDRTHEGPLGRLAAWPIRPT